MSKRNFPAFAHSSNSSGVLRLVLGAVDLGLRITVLKLENKAESVDG
jgi:hypothetical protein